MTPIDIRPADLDTIRRILGQHVPDLEVRAFGSRVAWNARETSDLDLALMTDQPLSIDRTAKLRAAFTDSDLPFRVDIVDWATVSEKFRQRILADHVVLRAQTVEIAPLTTGSKAVQVDSTRRNDCGGWRETRLGDVITLKRGYDLPQSQRVDGPVPVVSSSGISDHHSESRVSGPGVVTGRYGTLGKVFFILDDFWPLNTALYVRDFKGNDPRFISYFLRSLDFSACSDKAAVPGLNRNHLHEESVRIPASSNEQRAIAHTLGTLDDKIELNRRMNATLEAMARALFRSWFVDFDPVRAKMEGRDTGLPKEIADLFPDRLVDSELGDAPEGWNVDSLAEHFDPVKGVSYKGSGLGGAGMPLHNLNSVHEGGGYKYEGIKFYAGDYADRHVVRPGDVIVANTEQGHDRLLIGYAAIVPRCFGDQGICSHHVYRLRPQRGGNLSPLFLHQLLNSRWMHDIVSRYANGTTVNMLPMDAVQKPMVLVPPRALLETFDALALDLEHRREQTVRESRSLGVVRDALLPKLVSGEVRVAGLEAPSGLPGLPAAVGTHGA